MKLIYKNIKLSVICLCILPNMGFCQKSVVFYGGLNITNTRYTLIKNNVTDTASYTKDNIVLPWIGFDYHVPISKRFNIVTGLGVSRMGTSNYVDKVDTSIINYPGVLENILKKPHLKITYLRIPLLLEYKLNKSISPYIGYSFNYSIRKNQNFWAAEVGNVLSYRNIYSNYHHALLAGVAIEYKNLVLSGNYHLGISKIWDTTDYKPDQRAYLTMQGFQISIGYKVTE